MLKSITEKRLRHYFEEVGKYPLLDKEEEYKLAKRFREKKDEAAKEKLILSNQRIVISICLKFKNRGFSLSELINLGNKGLIRAVERFDERKGYRLSTYAVWWIKREIYEAINADLGIVPKTRLAHRIRTFMKRFNQQKGREPSIDEIAEGLKISKDKVSSTITRSMPLFSLDMTFDSEGIDTPYIEKIQPGEITGNHTLLEKFIAPAPEEVFKKKVEKENLTKALNMLSPREQEIIKRIFGLDEYDPQSLEEISRVMNITRERVRQIRENALKKLKLFYSSQLRRKSK